MARPFASQIHSQMLLGVLQGLVFIGVIAHLALLLIESSYFGDIFAFLGHTGLMYVHIWLLTFVAIAAVAPIRKLSFAKPMYPIATFCFLYGAWEVFCTYSTINHVDRLCEMVLCPLTIIALFLAAPCILQRRDYRSIFMLFSGLFALHTVFVLWIMCTNESLYFGRQLMGTDGHPKILGPFHFAQTDGIFRSPNGIGSFLALFPGFLLSEFQSQRSARIRALLAVAGGLIAVGLVLSFCRAAEAAVLVGMLFPVWAFMKNHPAKRNLVCAALLVATFCVSLPDHHQWSYIKSSISERVRGPEQVPNVVEFIAHTTTTHRTEIWMAFAKDWQTRPVRGYGLLGVDYQGMGPHNFLLANLVYFGVPGLLLLLTILGLAVNQMVARIRQHPQILTPIAGGLAALALVHGAVEYSITYPEYFTNSAFWLLLGYTCFTPIDQQTDWSADVQLQNRVLKDDRIPVG